MWEAISGESSFCRESRAKSPGGNLTVPSVLPCMRFAEVRPIGSYSRHDRLAERARPRLLVPWSNARPNSSQLTSITASNRSTTSQVGCRSARSMPPT